MRKLVFILVLSLFVSSCTYDEDIFINYGDINSHNNQEQVDSTKTNNNNSGTISFGVSDVEEG